MNKRKILLVVAFALAISGVLFSYYNFNKPVVIKEIKDNPLSVLKEDEKEAFTEDTDWYEAKIIYPKNNKLVSDEIFKNWQAFIEETDIKKYTNLEDAKVGLAINVEGLKYAFDADYKITTASGSISYVYQIYTFTGGAHGSTVLKAITLNDRQEIIPVEQILPTEKLVKVSKIAFADLQKQKYNRLKSTGGVTEEELKEIQANDDFLSEGVKPTRENYSVAWYDGEDIVISFGQYQVASYAEGMFEVRIKKSDL